MTDQCHSNLYPSISESRDKLEKASNQDNVDFQFQIKSSNDATQRNYIETKATLAYVSHDGLQYTL